MARREQECLEQLLSSSLTIAEKSELLVGLVSYWELVGTKVGLTVLEGRAFCYDQLIKELPKADKISMQQLKDVLNEIYEHAAKKKQQRTEKQKELAETLSSVKKGSVLRIRNQNREDIVRLIEVKRSRFICEYPDGRRYSFPVESFVAVTDTPIIFLSEQERQLREVIRMLASSHSKDVCNAIVKRGTTMLKVVLDEFGDVLDRIKNAPTGISHGVFGAALGPVKKVNPRDETLAKRIPEIIVEIAKTTGVTKVRREIEEYPNIEVRRLCVAVLDKLKC